MANYKPLGVSFDRTFRNDLNENFRRLDTVSRSVQTQVNNLVLASGTSNAEVVQARGEYPVLNQRLDESEFQLEKKRDKDDRIQGTELDTSSDITKVRIVNLADEVIRAMTGNAQVSPTIGNSAVVREKLANGAVTREKTQFQKLVSANVVDTTTVIQGGFYSPTSGNFSSNAGYFTTAEITVKSGESYRTNAASLAFFTSAYQFVSGVSPSELSGASGVFTVPSGAFYLRLNFVSSVAFPVCTKNTANYLQAFEQARYADEQLRVSSTNIGKDFVITPKNADFFSAERTENLFDPDNVVLGRYNELGEYALSSSNPQVTSNFIPVTPGDQLISSSSGYVTFYDAQKNFVSGMTPRTYFTVPSGVAFARTTSFVSTKDQEMVVKGTTLPPSYVPYLRYKIKSQYTEFNYVSKYKGKKWNVLGDSISVNKNFASKLYHEYINDEFGFGLIRNYGIGGSTVAKLGDDTNNSMALRYGQMDDDADMITVFGGTNDSSSGRVPIGQMSDRTVDTFYGAYHVLLSGLIEKYPGKKIAVFTPLQRASADTKPYAQVVREVAAYYSVPCLDLFAGGGLYAGSQTIVNRFMPDGLHPNADGHKIFSSKIASFLNSL
ncbi:SGNH/GDSL hydrolase family protein [Rossellomorea marisflavi]|uniref:SGNH/GDSL hydrolase family protein n=1 Tax=Rossellomorea marisflavi TaxID=189381 RepID=A0A5D4S319_9BACI|nr:SGNH/GDSL hydrolase family protein [Rossellomorea marisflavi]TYS56991.1 SGNH/GDSL hydrolase family protein [Rossellomorea marisflavi]